MSHMTLRHAAPLMLVCCISFWSCSKQSPPTAEQAEKSPSGASSSTLAASSGLLILKATYGAGDTQRDVKDLVESKIQNGRLDFQAQSDSLGGDPIFGQVKTLYIKYDSGGRVVEKSFKEGEHVSLP
jgi:hypothetical protein